MILHWDNFLEVHTKDNAQPAGKFNRNTKAISQKSMLTAIENYKKYQFESIPKEVKQYMKGSMKQYATLAQSFQTAFETNLLTNGQDVAAHWVLTHSEEYAKAWQNAPFNIPHVPIQDRPRKVEKIPPNIKNVVYVVRIKNNIKVFEKRSEAFALYATMKLIEEDINIEMQEVN